MITLRFSNGQAITYNDANYLTHGQDGWHLYKDKDHDNWICSFPNNTNIIVEYVKPCKIENPIQALTIENAFEVIQKLSESKDKNYSYYFKKLKRMLNKYNIINNSWK
jgi:hypothetical protein